MAPLELDGSVVEVLEQLKHLVSPVEASGGVVGEASCRIPQASRAFGRLHNFMFTVSNLTISICSVRSIAIWC